MSHDQTVVEAHEVERIDGLADRSVERLVDAWTKLGLPPDRLHHAMTIHGALSLAVRIGAGPIAEDLRQLADNIERDLGARQRGSAN